MGVSLFSCVGDFIFLRSRSKFSAQGIYFPAQPFMSIGGLFNVNWGLEPGFLPGLYGASVEMPAHLQ